jgi:ribosome-associated protein
VNKAREALAAKKGEDLAVLDVRDLSNVTDYYLIVTGNNSPHLKALATEVERTLKDVGSNCYRRAGSTESKWIVCDYIDFVVHIFSAEMRAYYALERLWNDAKRVE